MKLIKDILTVDEHFDDLSKRSDEIDVRKDATLMREITKSLKDTMRENKLVSLSAPAIGFDKRIFCLDFQDSEIKTFINPVIVEAKGLTLAQETCTSVPNKMFIRPRNTSVKIFYQRPTGQTEAREFLGMAAVKIQHEIDHLDGLLISDVGLEIDDDFENATEEERAEIINAYLDSLDIKQKEIQQEIEEDPQLKETSNAIKFIESVYKGETQIEFVPKEENLNGEAISDKTEENKPDN